MKQFSIFLILFFIMITCFTACTTTAKPAAETVPVSTSDELDAGIYSMADRMLADMAGKKGLSIAVLDFTLDNEHTQLSRYIAEELTGIFHSSGTVKMIERENLDTVLDEQQFQLSGNVDDNTAKSIGRIAGADMLCYGRITELPGSVRISARIIDVESGILVSIANMEVPKTEKVKSLLGTAEKKQSSAGETKKEEQMLPHPSDRPDNQASSASANPDLSLIQKNRDELATEEAQIQAIRDYQEYMIDYFPDITVKDIKTESKVSGSTVLYTIEFTWNHTDKMPVVNEMKTFFQTFADAGQGNRKRSFTYYPSAYASKTQQIAFPIYQKANSVLKYGFHWELEFTLLDRDGLPIDIYKTTLTRTAPWGKSSRDSKGWFFNISEEAYAMVKEVRLTKKTGSIYWMENISSPNAY
ncbi:CsgG/HfaB family protein [Brucepastera parasyntrophica]|uniref:FlgO family outer membrane protein n=1 Tax=Brucepastera parasyntrophica TaxID=2880008 RepID=UPI00210D3302|nr:FlgO family outer membrane protein [Brucepastera parasyntrophica]ULQ60395.1 CsgG/HfaB family protein [Brucepastera parasyntrophica]